MRFLVVELIAIILSLIFLLYKYDIFLDSQIYKKTLTATHFLWVFLMMVNYLEIKFY